jgi:ABC-type transport system involved in cytochrome bd biosynthesis fused ATPase/permease subunit
VRFFFGFVRVESSYHCIIKRTQNLMNMLTHHSTLSPATLIQSPASVMAQPAVQEYQLLPNAEQVGAKRILKFFAWVLLPLFVGHVLFYQTLELRAGEYLLAQLPVALVFFNLFYFSIRSRSEQQMMALQVVGGELLLQQGGQVLHSLPLSELQVEELGWGLESDELLPALRLQGPSFPALVIGSTATDQRWEDVSRSVAFADVLVRPATDWQQLKQLLQGPAA